uniref:Cytochrome P450, family 1, subfamily C, polypeptide 1 n=1 Tax=Poecilia latipinna TaxID=48699 RepID=A0A3B3VXR0_9TELE
MQFDLKSSGIIRLWSVQPALIASVVFLLCLEACLWVRNLKLKRRPPGPFAWSVVGNALQLGQMPHVAFTKLAKKYRDVYKIRLGCSDIVVLNGAYVIREALIQHSTGFAVRGKSLTFTNYRKQWRMHRKIAQTTIREVSSSNSHTKKAVEHQIVAEAAELVEIFLKLSTQDKYFNPRRELTAAAENVICALRFGKRYGHDDVEFISLLHHVDQFGQTVGAGSLVDVMAWIQSFPNPVRSVFKTFKWLKSSSISSAAKWKLTKDYAEAMVADLIGAGMDTVSTALHWIVLLPAKHPDIHTKLHELTDRVDEADCHLMRTEYTCVTWIPSSTRQCVSPVLSLSPSPTQKPQMSLWGGLRIPKDTVIFINQWSVNHDPLRKWIADQFEIFFFETCPNEDFSLKCSCGLTLNLLYISHPVWEGFTCAKLGFTLEYHWWRTTAYIYFLCK